MAAAPGHPFLLQAVNNLKRYDLHWISSYATDMYVHFPTRPLAPRYTLSNLYLYLSHL